MVDHPMQLRFKPRAAAALVLLRATALRAIRGTPVIHALEGWGNDVFGESRQDCNELMRGRSSLPDDSEPVVRDLDRPDHSQHAVDPPKQVASDSGRRTAVLYHLTPS